MKSELILKVLDFVVERVELFNEMDFPFSISKLGINSGRLVELDGNISVFVRYKIKKEIYPEWVDFQEVVRTNITDLHKFYSSEEDLKSDNRFEKLTAEDLLALRKMGFTDRWIFNWLPWIRVDDIIEGKVDSDTFRLDFEKLFNRFIMSNWSDKKIKITLDREREDGSFIWSRESGSLIGLYEEGFGNNWAQIGFEKFKEILFNSN